MENENLQNINLLASLSAHSGGGASACRLFIIVIWQIADRFGGQTAEAAAAEGKWVYLFVTKAKAKAATFAAAASAANIVGTMGTIQLQHK